MILDPSGPGCPSGITTTLTNEEIRSLYDDVVNPFYEKIHADNELRHYIDSGVLPGLKIKQTTFILRFLTSELSTLQAMMVRVGEAHNRIKLDMSLFAPYFFVWSELLITWLVRAGKCSEADLCLWRAKIFALMAHLSIHHEGMRRGLSAINNTANPMPSSTKETNDSLSNMVRHIHEEQVRNKTSAADFLARFDFDRGMIDELKELEGEVHDLMEEEGISSGSREQVCRLFASYAHLLDNTYEFKELGFALQSLADLMAQTDEAFFQGASVQKTGLFVNGILEDIGNWREAVFIRQDAIDVHYLDASLFSSIAQLQLILSPGDAPVAQDDGDELELF